MHRFITELFPLCRSITGNGVRATLQAIAQRIPLTLHEVPSGTPVLDWTVPQEWNIRDAFIKNARGERLVDFSQSNLHVVNYSIPVHATMTLDQLRPHLFSLPAFPDWIPYRTSYYTPAWGFCLRHTQLAALRVDEEYEVCIDATLDDGFLTYGESYLPGTMEDEILLSCHVCHPSLANDNLSSIAVMTFLAQYLQRCPRRYSYRFLFIPGTIGSITWLARNEAHLGKIKHGLVLTCVGDAGPFTYKRSRRGNAVIDRAVPHVLRQAGLAHEVIDFFPYGYDERQYCSPGFNLPVGCLMRARHGQFPEYHTSADNLQFIQPTALEASLALCATILATLDGNTCYRNLLPKGEPQLGKRGLYRITGSEQHARTREMAMLWVLNYADGEHTLLDIAERANLPFQHLRQAADALLAHQLLADCGEENATTAGCLSCQTDGAMAEDSARGRPADEHAT
jgi:aminopeptidase-like protein